MRFRVTAAFLCGLVIGATELAAQASNNNPAASDAPVFLDNHRSATKKKDKAPTARNVTGKVVDVNGTPLQGALVTLTDTKSNEKTTVITKSDGRYRFDDLSFSVDYELQARYKSANGDPRKLSQYDHNPNVVRILQIDDSANGSTTGEAKKTSPQQ